MRERVITPSFVNHRFHQEGSVLSGVENVESWIWNNGRQDILGIMVEQEDDML